jgi:poly(A) polymerase
MALLDHPALQRLADATRGTVFEGYLWLVGGAVRDSLLGRPHSQDFDLVIGTKQDPDSAPSSEQLARFLEEQGVAESPPVTYAQFGTAMVRVAGVAIEFVDARKESYRGESRKPTVSRATLLEDARRRDFTVNALLLNLHRAELWDPLGTGLSDLEQRILRTPLEPRATFSEDPLRMLRAVRFRWQLGFEPVPGLYEAIQDEHERLGIISAERIRAELEKMLLLPDADQALADLMDLGLLDVFAPELRPMQLLGKGGYHHLDVWRHSLLVMRNAGPGDLILTLSAWLHDIGKPGTVAYDANGNARYFGHEGVGADMAHDLLTRLRFPSDVVDRVRRLIKNHMRLGSSASFSDGAARRLIRDLGPDLERLLKLVEADASSLRPGVRVLDLSPIRQKIAQINTVTPIEELESPLSGDQIMEILGLEPGPEVGAAKAFLLEKVLDGDIFPGDASAAEQALRLRQSNLQHDPRSAESGKN